MLSAAKSGDDEILSFSALPDSRSAIIRSQIAAPLGGSHTYWIADFKPEAGGSTRVTIFDDTGLVDTYRWFVDRHLSPCAAELSAKPGPN
jgi:hypothetical protein